MAELQWLTDGVDNHLMELQYRSGSVAAPLAIALLVLIPTSLFAILPSFSGAMGPREGLILLGLLVVIAMLARFAVAALEWLTGHRDQLRWLLDRRQAYLAEIRRLEAEDAAQKLAQHNAFLSEFINATRRRPRWRLSFPSHAARDETLPGARRPQ